MSPSLQDLERTREPPHCPTCSCTMTVDDLVTRNRSLQAEVGRLQEIINNSASVDPQSETVGQHVEKPYVCSAEYSVYTPKDRLCDQCGQPVFYHKLAPTPC